jgi:hypothetical protein
MKKLLTFIVLFLSWVSLFAAGDVTFSQSGGSGGTVTIQQATGSGAGSGGGGSSTLAVGTGTASNFTNNITSPTAAISFLGTQFKSVASGTTNFMTLNQSSVTVEGKLLAGSNITLTPGAGTLTIASSGGGASVAIQDEGSYLANVGTINFVGAGVSAALLGTSSVTVTIAGGGGLPLTSGDTNYIQNSNTLQSGSTAYPSFVYVGSSATVTGELSLNGTITVDEPSLSAGSGANRSSMIFNPDASAYNLNLRTYNLSGIDGGVQFQNYLGDYVAKINVPPQLTGSFQIQVATNSTNGLKTRYIISGVDGKHNFYSQSGLTSMVQFDPIGNSSFTIPAYFASSMTLSGGVRVQNIAPITNQVLKYDGTNWAPGTDNSGGGSSVYPSTSAILVPGIIITSSSVFKTDIYSAGAGLCTVSSGCVTPSQYVTNTTSTNFVGAIFPYGTTSYWELETSLPENYVSGSTLTARIIYTSTSTSGNMLWNIQMKVSSDGTTMDGPFGTNVTSTGTHLGSYFNSMTSESGSITPAGTLVGGSSLFVRIYRGVSASDTITSDVIFKRIRITYPIDNISARD